MYIYIFFLLFSTERISIVLIFVKRITEYSVSRIYIEDAMKGNGMTSLFGKHIYICGDRDTLEYLKYIISAVFF